MVDVGSVPVLKRDITYLQPTTESPNQPTNQPTNRPTNQPNQPTHRPTDQPTNQPTYSQQNEQINQPAGVDRPRRSLPRTQTLRRLPSVA